MADTEREQALSELADSFGEGVGNAEAMIKASRARYAGDLGMAQNRSLDEEATEEVRGRLGDVAKHLKVKKDAVVDASVRGDFVVAAYRDDSGRVQKVAFARTELGGKAKASRSKSDDE